MNYEQINLLLHICLLEIYYRDAILLDRHVREECINHRLAYYFETMFTEIIHDGMFYTVDLEYNKNVSRFEKQIEISNNAKISIRPDIIIHQRQDNNNNLLALEAKLVHLTPHDILKLAKLLRSPYNYKYTVGVKYNPYRPYFTYTIFRLEDNNVISETVNVEKQ